MANENSISSDLIRGHIDTIILRSLYDGDKHGNDICLDIEDKSGGQYEIKQPTLYSALKRLETTGLVDAYWSSGVGGRRRYFRLTDEGKKVCEDNFNLWIVSRNIIDKLISDGGDLGYPIYQPTSVTPSPVPADFYEEESEQQPKFNPADYENYTFAPTPPVEDEFEYSEPIVFNNENDDFQPAEDDSLEPIEDDSPILKTVDDTDAETRILAEENENNLNNISDESDVFQLSLIKVEDEITEETSNIEEEVYEPEIIEEPEETDTSPVDEEETIDEGEDDLLVIEPYKSPEKEYSDILSTLYPLEYEFDYSNTTSPITPVQEEPTQEEVVEEEDDEIPASEIPPRKKHKEHPVDNEAVIIDIPREEEKEKPKEIEPKPGEIDYSDILSLANMQGFRVKTSDRTNKAVKGKLYFARLNATSATLLFITMLIEMAIICFSLREVLSFTWIHYTVLTGILFVFPFICYLILPFAFNKTINKLPTLKYCITASSVIVLNLILFTFALSLLFQLDLYNAQLVLTYLVIPFIIYINIPLFFIIKYSLLSKGLFFSKK